MYSKAIFAFIFIALLGATGCGTPKGPLYAEGEIVGEVVAANMDSEIAMYALSPSEDEPAELKQLRQKLERTVGEIPSAAELQYLAQQGSTDFASVVYARAMLTQPGNRRWQTRSHLLRTQLSADETKQRLQKIFADHHALVVPGWHWRSRPETGAALSYPRKILASYGLQSTLVETDEHGSVEKNGKIIAQAIIDARSLQKSIVLVSASKGGADTAYALGGVLNDNQMSHLKGWLNVGGIIAGSTLIDLAADNPQHWLDWLGFDEDTPLTAVHSLTTAVASARLAKLEFSEEVTIINYAALPFGSTLQEKPRYGYTNLAAYGPNDGAALIQQLLVPGTHTVLEIGLDHYMRSPRAMHRLVALLMMIMECKAESICD